MLKSKATKCSARLDNPSLGRVLFTVAALRKLDPKAISDALNRRALGDYGDFSTVKDLPTAEVGDWLASYPDQHGNMFLVVTTPDRALTIIMLMEEYPAEGTAGPAAGEKSFVEFPSLRIERI